MRCSPASLSRYRYTVVGLGGSGPLHLLPAELFRPQSFQFLLFFFVHNYSSVSMVSSALRRSSSSASFTHGSCSRMVRLDSRGERDSSVLASAV